MLGIRAASGVSGGGGGAGGGTLIAAFDPSDLATLFSDAGGTTPSVVDGPVRRINEKSGNGWDLVAAGDWTLRQSGSLYWLDSPNASTTALTSAAGRTWPTSTDLFMAVRPEAGEVQFVLLYDGSDSGKFLGVAQDGGGSSNNLGCGSPATFVNGVAVSPDTRDGLQNALAPATVAVLEIRGATMAFDKLAVGGGFGSGYDYGGQFYGLTIYSALTTGEGNAARTAMGAKAGMTL